MDGSQIDFDFGYLGISGEGGGGGAGGEGEGGGVSSSNYNSNSDNSSSSNIINNSNSNSNHDSSNHGDVYDIYGGLEETSLGHNSSNNSSSNIANDAIAADNSDSGAVGGSRRSSSSSSSKSSDFEIDENLVADVNIEEIDALLAGSLGISSSSSYNNNYNNDNNNNNLSCSSSLYADTANVSNVAESSLNDNVDDKEDENDDNERGSNIYGGYDLDDDHILESNIAPSRSCVGVIEVIKVNDGGGRIGISSLHDHSVPTGALLAFDDSPANSPPDSDRKIMFSLGSNINVKNNNSNNTIISSSNNNNNNNNNRNNNEIISNDPSLNWKEREFIDSWTDESTSKQQSSSSTSGKASEAEIDDSDAYGWLVYDELAKGLDSYSNSTATASATTSATDYGKIVPVREPSYAVSLNSNINSNSSNISYINSNNNINSNTSNSSSSNNNNNNINSNKHGSNSRPIASPSPVVVAPVVIANGGGIRQKKTTFNCDDDVGSANANTTTVTATRSNGGKSSSSTDSDDDDDDDDVRSIPAFASINNNSDGNEYQVSLSSLSLFSTSLLTTTLSTTLSTAGHQIITTVSTSMSSGATKVAEHVSEIVTVENMMGAVSSMGSQTSKAFGAVAAIGGRAGELMSHNPWVKRATGAVSETCHFTSDRVKQLADYYGMVLTCDDPETQYLTKLNGGGREWDVLLRTRSRFATLDWKRRQLIRETRDDSYAVDFKMSAVGDLKNSNLALSTKSISSSNLASASALVTNPIYSSSSSSIVDVKDVNVDRIVKENILKNNPSQPEVLKLLIDDANRGDEDSQYVLAKWFSPPAFAEKTFCSQCQRSFGINLFRHHCRNCGNSFCSDHSQSRRKLLHHGMVTPVRVCDACAELVDIEESIDLHLWKDCRVGAFLKGREADERVGSSGNINNGVLIPYSSPAVDRGVDKAYRVMDYTLQFLKNNIILNYPAKIAVETVNILKLYGMSGLAGVLLRKDFVEAVETLKRISGIDKMFSLSLHELTAAIYYKIAINRGIRGCIPEEEHRRHRPSNNSANTSYKCRKTRDDELHESIRLAPLALKAVYEEEEVENQRIARSQGWSLLYCESKSLPEKPAYSLYASHLDNRHVIDHDATIYKGEVVVAVRGTSTIQDVVTDIRSSPMSFPPSKESLDRVFRGEIYKEKFDDSKSVNVEGKGGFYEDDDKVGSGGGSSSGGVGVGGCDKEDAWEWLQMSGDMHYACGGMARAAMWLLSQVGPSLIRFHQQGYRITLTGHSLGGAVAVMLAYLIKSRIPSTTAVVYSCPACVDEAIAEETRSYVLTVILRDDVIPRFTPRHVRLLMRELTIFKDDIRKHLQQDWRDAVERAGNLWSPKWRQIHSSHQARYSSSSSSSSSASGGGGGGGGGRGGGGGAAGTRLVGVDDYFQSSSSSSSSAGGDSCLTSKEILDYDDLDNDSSNDDDDDDECDSGEFTPKSRDSSASEVLVGDDEMIDLWVPGVIIHIYSRRGKYRSAIIRHDDESLRKIEVLGNIFADHFSKNVFNALLEVKAVLNSGVESPDWVPFDRFDKCQCCNNRFTWHSTFQGDAQELRDRHNCRACGNLVCGPCSTKKAAIPKLGVLFPTRVCDVCFYKGEHAY